MKLKYKASKGLRINRHFRWAALKNFTRVKDAQPIQLWWDIRNKIIYDSNEQSKLLYNAQPCIHTDSRFNTDIDNIKVKTTRAFRRKIRGFKNISTHEARIDFLNKYYHQRSEGKGGMSYEIFATVKPSGEKIDFRKDNKEYMPDLSSMKDSKAKLLGESLLREGFLVKIFDNNEYDDSGEGKAIMAFGYDKKIGFSEFGHRYFGYEDGRDMILFDWYGEFDKWSRCAGIPKSATVEEIITRLKAKKD